MLLQKIWFGNISEVYEVEVPQLEVKSKVVLDETNEKGVIELDWSNYDISNKYFVIYCKQEGEEQWKTIVNLDEKFNSYKYIDNLANDKVVPKVNNINIIKNAHQNGICIFFNSYDEGTKYMYYVEAYDSNDVSLLLQSSNIVEV